MALIPLRDIDIIILNLIDEKCKSKCKCKFKYNCNCTPEIIKKMTIMVFIYI